jgi:peroxiredoxin
MLKQIGPKRIGFVALLTLAVGPSLAVAERPAAEKSGGAVAFSLKDGGGHDVALSDFRDKQAVVVVFTGIECPVSNYYVSRLKELSKVYSSKGVQFLAVNSNAQDSLADVADHARQQGLPFPVLKDADQKVLELLRAERTPEVVLLDANRTIRYRGRIDDQFGVGFRRPQPSRRDLAQAVDEVLAGKPVSVARTQAAGCRIARQNKPVETARSLTRIKSPGSFREIARSAIGRGRSVRSHC